MQGWPLGRHAASAQVTSGGIHLKKQRHTTMSEDSLQLPREADHMYALEQRNSVPGNVPREILAHINQKTHTESFRGASNWKQPKCPSPLEWIINL